MTLSVVAEVDKLTNDKRAQNVLNSIYKQMVTQNKKRHAHPARFVTTRV